MPITPALTAALRNFYHRPDSASHREELEKAYWEAMEHLVESIVYKHRKASFMFGMYGMFLNFGISRQLPQYKSIDQQQFQITHSMGGELEVTWPAMMLSRLMHIAAQGSEKELLMREERKAKMGIFQLKKTISFLRARRKALLDQGLEKSGIKSTRGELAQQVENLYVESEICHVNAVSVRRNIAAGVYIAPATRRDLLEQDMRIKDIRNKIAIALSNIDHHATEQQIEQLSKQILGALNNLADEQLKRNNINTELEALTRKTDTTQPAQLNQRIIREVFYIQRLCKICAKKAGVHPVPVPLAGHHILKPAEIKEAVFSVLSFDIELFSNDRVGQFGLPIVVLVPCYGDALYDWKNNWLVVPVFQNHHSALQLIAQAVIDYRLEIMKNTPLLAEYSHLLQQDSPRKENLPLQEQFQRDYVQWICQEVYGTSSISPLVGDFFSTRFALQPDTFFIPTHLRPNMVGKQEYPDLFKKVIARINDPQRQTAQNYWEAAIIMQQQGDVEKAIHYLHAALKKAPTLSLAWWNISICYRETGQLTKAIDALTRFSKAHPTGWWSSFAQKHLQSWMQNSMGTKAC